MTPLDAALYLLPVAPPTKVFTPTLTIAQVLASANDDENAGVPVRVIVTPLSVIAQPDSAYQCH